MFCNHCGAKLPDGSRFCSTCGADLTAAPAPAAQKPQPAPRANSETGSKKPKKKTPIWLTVVIVLAAFLIGKFVIAPSMLSEPDSTGGNSDSQVQETPTFETKPNTDLPNAAYDEVFADSYIVHFQMFFNMDTASFVKKLEDGTVYCADYGYKDDVVIDFVETMYIPVSEYTDEQKAEVESNMKASLSALEALACCSVKYNTSLNYLTVTMSYSGVDQAENYTALYDAGILTVNTFISMSETENALLSDGFIKK